MIGKWILIFVVVIVLVGAMIWLVESLGLPMGRLPGDIRMRGEGWSFSFPVVTCIIVSVVLTVGGRAKGSSVVRGVAMVPSG